LCANLTISSCVYADDTVSPESPDFSSFFFLLFLFLFHCQVCRGSGPPLGPLLILYVDISFFFRSNGPPHAVVLWTPRFFRYVWPHATLLPCSPCNLASLSVISRVCSFARTETMVSISLCCCAAFSQIFTYTYEFFSF